MTARRLAIPASLLVAVLALTGCSQASELKPEDSPLTQLWNKIEGTKLSETERIQQLEQQKAVTEELIAECMTEQGFEYAPEPLNDAERMRNQPMKFDDREWLAQYGFGVANWPGRDELSASLDAGSPNDAYAASLGEAEQGAFYEALYGPSNEAEMNGDTSWENDGCYGWAQHENPDTSINTSHELVAYNEALLDFFETPPSDPRLDEAEAAWAECIADAGYTEFTKRDEMFAEVNLAIEEYYQEHDFREEEGAEYQELRDNEITIALADFDCRTEVDYDARTLPVYFEYEQKFMDENTDIIDALLAFAESGGK